MRRVALMCGLSLAVVAIVISFAFLFPSAADEEEVNIAQVDGGVFSCSSSNFLDIPNLVVTLETDGEPVLVMFTVQVIFSTNAIADLRPVIDGVPGTLRVSHATGAFQGGTATLSYSRAFSVDEGTHTFGVQCSGQNSPLVSVGWLTVHELGD